MKTFIYLLILTLSITSCVSTSPIANAPKGKSCKSKFKQQRVAARHSTGKQLAKNTYKVKFK